MFLYFQYQYALIVQWEAFASPIVFLGTNHGSCYGTLAEENKLLQ